MEGTKSTWPTVYSEAVARKGRLIDERVSGADLAFHLKHNRVLIGKGAASREFTPLVLSQIGKMAGLPPAVMGRFADLSQRDDVESASPMFNELFMDKCGDRPLTLIRDRQTDDVLSIIDSSLAIIPHAEVVGKFDDELTERLGVDEFSNLSWLAQDNGDPHRFNWIPRTGTLEVTHVLNESLSATDDKGRPTFMGLRLSHSDLLGTGPMVDLFTYTQVCTNGMIVERREDYGLPKVKRRVMVSDQQEAMVRFADLIRSSFDVWEAVARRMIEGQQVTVHRPQRALAALFHEFRVPDDEQAVVYSAFTDVPADSSVSLYDLVFRLTQSAQELNGGRERMEAVAGRVLAMPLDRLDVEGTTSRKSSAYRTLKFKNPTVTKAELEALVEESDFAGDDERPAADTRG